MNEIITNFFREFCLIVQRVVTALLGIICDIFIGDGFTPSLNTFANLFYNAGVKMKLTQETINGSGQGGAYLNQILGTTGSSTEGLSAILSLFERVGFTIVLVLIGFTAFTYMFGHVIEIKDSMQSVFKRAIFAVMLVYIIGSFGAYVAVIGEGANAAIKGQLTMIVSDDGTEESSWTNFVTDVSANKDGSSDGESSDEQFTGVLAGENLPTTYAYIQQLQTGADAQAGVALGQIIIEVVSLVVNIMLYIVVAYNLLKLCVELIKRYVVYGCLFMISPAMAGFTVTSEGSVIFMTYLKMFFTQLGILIMTNVWISLSLFLMGNIETNILGCFILIAFINIGVRLEGMARDMGFTASQQGMALLDSVATTVMIMGHAISGVTQAVGGGAIVAGSAAGAPGAVQLGHVLTGRPIDPESIARSMQNNPGSKFRETFGGEITKGEQQLLSKLAQNGFTNNRALTNEVAHIQDAKAACQSILNSTCSGLLEELSATGLSLEATGAIEGGPHGGIGVQLMNEEGNALIDGVVSDNKFSDTAYAFTTATGATKYFNPTGEPLLESLKNGGGGNHPLGKKGEKFSAERPTSTELAMGHRMPSQFMVKDDIVTTSDENGNPVSYNRGDFAENYSVGYGDNGERTYFYTPDGGDSPCCIGYENNRMTIGEPAYQSDFNDYYNNNQHEKMFEAFTSPDGIFRGLNFTPSEVQQVSGSSYIFKGTNAQGREISISVNRALDSVNLCNGNNTRKGWRIAEHRPERKVVK